MQKQQQTMQSLVPAIDDDAVTATGDDGWSSIDHEWTMERNLMDERTESSAQKEEAQFYLGSEYDFTQVTFVAAVVCYGLAMIGGWTLGRPILLPPFNSAMRDEREALQRNCV